MALRTRLARQAVALAVAGFGVAGPVWAERVSSDLAIIPSANNNRLNLTVTATIALGTRSDSDTATISGNVLTDATLLFDPVTHAVSNIHGLELAGGQFSISNVSMRLEWKVFFVTVAYLNLTTSNVGGTFDTPNPPGLVVGNGFDAAEHQVIFNRGTFVATGTVSSSMDFAAQPLAATGTGTGTIAIGNPTLSAGVLAYPMSISIPIAFDQVVYDEPGTGTARATGNGNMLATGTLTRPLPVNVPTWNTDGAGDWGNASNWTTAFPDAPGATAWLLTKLSAPNAPATISLDADRTVGTLVLKNPNRYTVVPGTGGSLRMDNGGGGSVIHVIQGSHVVAAPVAFIDGGVIDVSAGASLQATGGLSLAPGRTLTKRGAGMASLGGSAELNASSILDVVEGVLSFDRIQNGTLRIGAYGLASLDPDGIATGASVVDRLQLAGAADAWQATLDLNRGRLVVRTDGASAQAVLAELIDQVACARDGAAGPWTGKGITSSAAGADVAGLTGIGVFLNSTRGGGAVAYSEFGGVPVDANSILMRATWLGDANLDGIVDADDYFLIDRGFRTQEGGWYNGDFNYDGVVNALDYVLIDRSFLGQSLAVVPRAASVPEPSAFGIGVVGLALLCRRRRAGI